MKDKKVEKIKLIKANKLKNKAIKLYIVVKSSDIDNNGKCDLDKVDKIYTITDSYETCNEYIQLQTVLDHMPHYLLWCAQRNLDAMDDANWDKYKEIVIGNECRYGIAKIDWCWEDILALLRILHQCYPIGCSFDRAVEKEYLKQQLKTTVTKDILKNDSINTINKEDIIN